MARPARTPPPPSPDLARIARINEVSAMARASWIAMLGYFAFVFVTLLGVEDADFFVPSRQTQLPLVNVAIPTASFFWFAPALGAALYVYLHIVLLKLCDAIADLEKPRVDGHPVGDLINPWLANDWALSKRGGDFTPARPLRVLGNVATFALVWAAGLFVLFFAWWRSMPAHKEGLTLWLGLCVIVAGLAGLDSWRAARAWLIPPRREPVHRPLWRRPGVAIAVAALAAASWARTEGGLDRYAGAAVDRVNQLFRPSKDPERPNGYLRQCYPAEFANDPQAEGPPVPDCFDAYGVAFPRNMVQEQRISAIWPDLDDLTSKLPLIEAWISLTRAEIKGVEMVVRPDGWRDFEASRRSYRETWCKREGLEMAACGQLATTDEPLPEHVGKKRRDWCALHDIPSDGLACGDRFVDFDRRFDDDWRAERAAIIADLPHLNLSGEDLRRAAAVGVMLEGANLRWTRLERANFRGARMEGADLRRARMDGANLFGARMDGVKLRQARLEGVNFRKARMQGANLGEARLKGADLREANLTGADLSWARLEKADLRNARLEAANLGQARMERADLREARFDEANLRGASFRDESWTVASNRESPAQFADFRTSQDLTQAQLEGIIGNDATLLPDRLENGERYYVWSCWDRAQVSVQGGGGVSGVGGVAIGVCG